MESLAARKSDLLNQEGNKLPRPNTARPYIGRERSAEEEGNSGTAMQNANNVESHFEGKVPLPTKSFAPRGTVTVKFRLRAKYPIRARTLKSRVYEYYDPDVSSVARPVQLEVPKR